MQTQTKGPNEPVNFDGRIAELYKIFFLNVFLGILTLGVYHFWGKTRIRRYITSSFNIADDRLEYTGYGSELLWGFLKALIILIILAIPLLWFEYENSATLDQIDQKREATINEKQEQSKPERSQNPTNNSATLILPQDKTQEPKLNGSSHATSASTVESKAVSFIEAIKIGIDKSLSKLTPHEKKIYFSFIAISAIYSVFYGLYMPFVAVFSSLKYRVTRTRWRGIRGHMRGSSIIYGFAGVFHLLLKIATLGIWIPFGDALLWKYKMKHLSFGNQPAVYTPSYSQLFMSHLGTILFTLFISLLILGVYLACVAFFVLDINQMPYPPAEAGLLGRIVHYMNMLKEFLVAAMVVGIVPMSVGTVLMIIVGFIARFWYRATLTRVKYNALRFGDIRFNCTITGWKLFRQQFGNFLILLLTLGLGSPIVKIRRQRFFSRHFHIYGDLQNINVQQATGEKDKWGEGLGSMFDLEVGLF